MVQAAARTAWAVTVEEVKAQARIDGSDEDAYLATLIQRVQTDLELECDRAFSEIDFRLTMAAFPPGGIRIPRPPLKIGAGLVEIQYVDTNGVTQTLDASAYDIDADSEPAVITPVYGTTWPVTRDTRVAVTITFTAGGWDDARPLPSQYLDAIIATVAYRHENREDSGYPQAVIDNLPNLRLWATYPGQ